MKDYFKLTEREYLFTSKSTFDSKVIKYSIRGEGVGVESSMSVLLCQMDST